MQGYAGLLVLAGFYFPTGGTKVSEETFTGGAALSSGERQSSQHVVPSLTRLMKPVLVPEVQGEFQPHLCVLGFSQWRLVIEEFLFVLLVMGSKVKNNLYHYLGDVTSPFAFC